MGEGSSENVAPPSNTESESNQMMDSSEAVPSLPSKPAFGCVGNTREDSIGLPAAGGNDVPVAINGAAAAVLTDSNQMMVD